jgi:hypothetical protein
MRATKRIVKGALFVALCLVILEITARLLLATPLMTRRRFADELSWRRWWVRVHRSGQPMLYGYDRYDATKGWLSKPNLRDVPAFTDRRLNTNARGLRGTDDHARTKRPGVTRIVVLGDSFTFGEEVGDTETYSHYLQQLVPGAEVINMGVHGYGHDQMLIFFREEGVGYAPDVVVLGFVSVDMSRNLLGFRDYAKPRFRLRGDALELIGSPVPRPEEVVRGEWRRPRLLDAWSILAHEIGTVTGWKRREEERLTLAILGELVKTTRDLRAVPVFVYLPIGPEITSPASPTDGERVMFAACRRTGVALCVSSRPAFAEARSRGTSFGASRHWNAEGHKLVAATILRQLVTGGVVNISSMDTSRSTRGDRIMAGQTRHD